MSKHFVFSERVALQYYLDTNVYHSASKLSKQLNKARNSIYYEIKNHIIINKSKAENFTATRPIDYCEKLRQFPYVCNGCANTRCSHRSRFYDAYKADQEANYTLVNSRKDNERRKKVISVLNRSVCPLIKNGQSIHNAITNVNNCDISESSIRRYIELGLLDAKRMDLPRAIRFRVKKEYKYTNPPLPINVLNGRTYDDYKKYIKAYPNAKVVQLDSVIGKVSDKQAILTIFFKDSKLQLGKLYSKKYSPTVKTMRELYELAKKHNEILFDVVLADNGPEFKNLHELELDEEGNRICHVFFCDPYRSCQKAECEKNHVFFRRIFPKGRSFSSLTQDKVDRIFSHINSYSRKSLKDKSPFELFNLEYNPIILLSINILKIEKKDIKLIDFKHWDNN